MPDVDAVSDAGSLGYLIFTSGTSGSPKACRCTQGRMVVIGDAMMQRYEFDPDSVCYLSMPLFHSNCLMSGWAPAVVGGATIALPTGGRFSASGFLPDVRRHGVTYWNYVGRPLSYVLATPEQPNQRAAPARDVFGNEAAPGDVDRFATRFGCAVSENYGSTEGGIAISRRPTPHRGPSARHRRVSWWPTPTARSPRWRNSTRRRVAQPARGRRRDRDRHRPGNFEGYWENEEADQTRVRDGRYWSGDLAYKDAEGFLYFAGRGDDWLRVDGENFSAAPVQRIIDRHPDVVISAVYAVPDPSVGDQVMAAVQLRPGATFDGAAFGAFLIAQPDLGRKWVPRFVRVAHALPTTATSKILVRTLRTEGTDCDNPGLRARATP